MLTWMPLQSKFCEEQAVDSSHLNIFFPRDSWGNFCFLPNPTLPSHLKSVIEGLAEAPVSANVTATGLPASVHASLQHIAVSMPAWVPV